MSNINLLPDSFRVKSTTVKTSELLKKISVLLFVVLLVLVFVSVGLYLIFDNNLKEVAKRQNTLKQQIEALQDTEQRLIFVKNRLEKVNQIELINTSSEEIDGLKLLVDKSGADVIINKAIADKQSLGLEVASLDSVQILDFLRFMKESGEFKDALLQSMDFSPKAGFQSQILLVKK